MEFSKQEYWSRVPLPSPDEMYNNFHIFVKMSDYEKMKKSTPNFIRLEISSGEDNGTSLQYSCLENPMDGGA